MKLNKIKNNLGLDIRAIPNGKEEEGYALEKTFDQGGVNRASKVWPVRNKKGDELFKSKSGILRSIRGSEGDCLDQILKVFIYAPRQMHRGNCDMYWTATIIYK